MNAFLDIHAHSPIRFPFVMVDRIIEIGDDHIRTRKNVVLNDWFMQGHFIDCPIMPVPLMIESMAQSGILLFQHMREMKVSMVESSSKEPDHMIGVLAGVEKMRAYAPVYPGSILDIFVHVVSIRVGPRRQYARLFGTIQVEEQTVLDGFFKTSLMDVAQ